MNNKDLNCFSKISVIVDENDHLY